ncbi:UDP-glucose/GDP-mannose dehydrogenase family protein, partial [Priestia aryabhattai]|uniref:UDP-glucose dehydrogenase family protein n=1 Tax=Priestia aryabhattai TaxID=412384 RepID=UPI002E1C8554|nr:UDP-glucose/GDP-mannose dehydrogenase family protein [Priestia aryabhattai]
GLVTGVCLAEVNHSVVCVDTNQNKIDLMKDGVSPIYEPGLEEMMGANYKKGNLDFTTDHHQAFKDADAIFIAVGTPQKSDGTADLQYVESVAKSIAANVEKDTLVITKSTVPVGTNKFIKNIIDENLTQDIKISIASNPEFLREGSAISDTFCADRIVVGVEDERSFSLLKEIYRPFKNTPIYKTDVASAEMIKYASNAFLATKISFINEISNICEKLGANVIDVARGMGMDNRIGLSFLNAGIGYGGSCFPKDTHALVQIAGGVEHDFKLLKSVIEVNNNQQRVLIDKIKKRFNNDLAGKKVAMLGLAFKPNTDDMREAASIVIANELLELGMSIKAYDPVAISTAKEYMPNQVQYCDSITQTLEESDFAVILTEWDEFKSMDFSIIRDYLKLPILFDGRNCFELSDLQNQNIEYHSIGRPSIKINEYSHVN